MRVSERAVVEQQQEEEANHRKYILLCIALAIHTVEQKMLVFRVRERDRESRRKQSSQQTVLNLFSYDIATHRTVRRSEGAGVQGVV